MLAALRTRITRREHAIFALIIALCLLIAPVCAPLCAARMCAPAGQLHCHGMSGDDPSQGLIAPKNACRGLELSAILPRGPQLLPHSTALPRTAPVNAAPFAFNYDAVRSRQLDRDVGLDPTPSGSSIPFTPVILRL